MVLLFFWFFSFISFLLEEEPSSSTSVDIELPCSDSTQEHQREKENSSSARGSIQSLKDSRIDITSSNVETRMFSLIAPPPRVPDSKVKSRCSTLPSHYRGAEACYSLPRPCLSTSLTKLQQQGTLLPLVPLASSQPTSNKSSSSLHTSASPSSPQPSPVARQPRASPELFVLKGPPPQLPRSRGKTRCSTLPPRQRAPSAEELTARPSHSTSCTKLEDRIPPSPGERKRNSRPVWGDLQAERQRTAEGGLQGSAAHVCAWGCILPALLFTCMYYEERLCWSNAPFLFPIFILIFILSLV